MLRVIVACLVLVSIFTIGYLIHFFREERELFLEQFETRSKVVEIKTPDDERPTYKRMVFSDGKSLSVPDVLQDKVKTGDSVIKFARQHYFIWKNAGNTDTIPL